MKDNKGYSLIEMIIVIAIIAVMTGASLVTITVMRNAKAKAAASTLEDSLTELQQKAKGRTCEITNSDGTVSIVPEARYAIMVYKDGSTCYLKSGYYVGTGDMKTITSYFFYGPENANSGKGTSLSAYVSVKYIGEDGTERDVTAADPVLIVYDKQGMCVNGSGTFNFYRSNDNSVAINSVTLLKNGSHSSN